MNQSEISESYKKSYKKFGRDLKSLKWKNEKAAEKRYKELTSNLDFNNKTILDVGCGFGNIIPFIKIKTKSFTYTGIDIVPEFIKEAKSTYSEYEFKIFDFTKDEINQNYDIILASGSLNSNRDNNLKWRINIIKKLFAKCNYALTFNMAGDLGETNKKKNNIWYANPLEILKYCLTLTKKISFKTGYTYKDFTVVMYKKHQKTR
jgi:SAM-dependent methyltransferase